MNIKQKTERFRLPGTSFRDWLIHTGHIIILGPLSVLATILVIVGQLPAAYIGFIAGVLCILGTVYFRYGSPKRGRCPRVVQLSYLVAGVGISLSAFNDLTTARTLLVDPIDRLALIIGYGLLEGLTLYVWFYISMYVIGDVADLFVFLVPDKYVPSDQYD